MSDEALKAVDHEKGQETGDQIKYKVLQKIELSKRTGYCMSGKDGKSAKRYEFAGSTYAMQIKFKQGGEELTVFMLCELASSGLPANANCDEEVDTLDWVYGQDGRDSKISPASDEPRSSGGGSRRSEQQADQQNVDNGNRRAEPGRAASGQQANTWRHRNAEVRIIPDGNRRRIVFVSVNDRQQKRGLKPGDEIFVGQRNGDKYEGTAFVHHRRCGRIPFQVSGEVRKRDTVIVLNGKRPRLGKGCSTGELVDVRLVFRRD
jgi:hypothetical protein